MEDTWHTRLTSEAQTGPQFMLKTAKPPKIKKKIFLNGSSLVEYLGQKITRVFFTQNLIHLKVKMQNQWRKPE